MAAAAAQGCTPAPQPPVPAVYQPLTGAAQVAAGISKDDTMIQIL